MLKRSLFAVVLMAGLMVSGAARAADVASTQPGALAPNVAPPGYFKSAGDLGWAPQYYIAGVMDTVDALLADARLASTREFALDTLKAAGVTSPDAALLMAMQWGLTFMKLQFATGALPSRITLDSLSNEYSAMVDGLDDNQKALSAAYLFWCYLAVRANPPKK